MAVSGHQVPPAPGTAPVPEGHIRLWHYTSMSNLPSIREHGLLFDRARSDLGNGDLTQPSAGVWASTRPPEEHLKPHGGRGVIEFHAHPSQVSQRADYPISQDPVEWAKGYHHVIMKGDVAPSQFLAVHEPWHSLYRSVKERHGFDTGRYQHIREEYAADPEKNAHLRDYAKAIEAIDSERGIQATGAFVPAAQYREDVDHILNEFVPSDDATWHKVNSNYDWEHPRLKAMVEDIRRNGVQRPVPIDYEQDPPMVMNGHTRVLAAKRAGAETVPTRQHAGFMDPDDPDAMGRQPGDPEHWTSKPEWQAELKEQYGPKDDPSGDYKDSRQTAPLGHLEASGGDYRMQHTAPSPEAGHRSLDHYEGGDPDDRVQIYRSAPPGTESINPGDWISLSSEYAHGHGRHGSDPAKDWPVYTASVPQRHVHWDENDPNEHGYNGPVIHRPDVHDEETGEHRDWDEWHDEHPHGLEAWAGASAHLSPEDHDFVHDDTEWESDRADRLLDAARRQGSLRGAQWRDDLYPARDDAEAHAAAHLHEAPEGHRTTAFTVHRTDEGGIEGIGIHHYEPSEDPYPSRRYRHLDVEDEDYEHPATEAIGRTREASVQHHGISGETAPEGRDIFATPTGISPVDSHFADMMQHPEKSVRVNGDGEKEWVHPHLSAPDHGPYYIARDPEDPDVNEGTLHVLDRHGRSTNRAYKGGSWQHANAVRDWHRLTYREDPEDEGTRRDVPEISEDHDRQLAANPPQFPHSRIDPRDTEILKRPDARVARPEGHSPSDEYHGSYEVVRHPDTGRFHVVDNAGRLAGAGYDGAPTQLGAERSRDYIEKRQRSKEIGRGIANALWEGAHQAIDPGSTEESRESDRNLAAGQELMTRYEGGRGKVKFDSDEEGGAPYYEREHYLDNGKPSGWYTKHYGGPFSEIHHRATGDESHDMIRFPEHPEDEGRSMTPRLHPAFKDEHLAAELKDWHDDPETEARQYLEQNDRRISRWKQRRLGAAHPVVAHFEDPEPRPFLATAAPAGGEEYKPKPEWQRAPEGLSDEEHSAHYQRQSQAEHEWKAAIRRGLSMGHLTPDRAHELGYANNGHDRNEELWDHEGNIVVRRGWQPMPHDMYHATTNLPAVREHGLKSRRELNQSHGLGLGGGEDDTISLTADHPTAQNILRAMHEYHGVLNGRKTPQQMWEEARAGTGAKRPFHTELANYYSKWNEGEPLPRHLDETLRGVEVKSGGLVYSPKEMEEREGPGWRPHHESAELTGGDGVKRYNVWERPASPEHQMAQNSDLYKNFSYWRGHAGGPDDPLFITNDIKGFAAADPSKFGIAHVHPRPGAQGYPLSSLGEWRTTTGDALEVHRAERMEHGHLKEAAVSVASRFMPGLPNPHTHGEEWFHGTHSRPEDLQEGFHSSLPDDHESQEVRGHMSYWNTHLGSHWAAAHSMADHFARAGASVDDQEDEDWHEPYSRYEEKTPSIVVHAKLHLSNPKVYASEHDMDNEAYEHETRAGNWISSHFTDGYEHEDPSHPDYDPETPGEFEEWPNAAKFRHDSRQPLIGPDEHPIGYGGLFSNDHPGQRRRAQWLSSHPDKAGIVSRFRQRLIDQGHDGILYGNELETDHAGSGEHGALSAIAFHPHQVEITQHHDVEKPCLGGGEAERQRATMPQPGQEELPGVEEHADRFPNGFLRGHAVVAHFEDKPAQKTAAPMNMQLKLFHQQPNPNLNEPGSGRHNPSDPEAGYRYRKEHDEEYQPDECPECGGDRHFREQHEDEHSAYLDDQDWYTNWDGMDMPSHIHRGMAVHLPQALHDYVHDESRPVADRATALARHLAGEPGSPNSLGHYWSENPDQSKGYAEAKQPWVRPGAGEAGQHTPVMAHAHFPGRGHIETDPETLRHWKVLKYGYGRDNLEYPISEDAPIHLSGISWARPNHQHHDVDFPLARDDAWTHHEFGDEGVRAQAAMTGGPDEVSEREQRSDRWHEYQGRGDDHLHRGIVVTLPEHIDSYVHDESVPREDRAHALQQHFADSGEGLGMHWTPHPRIAQRAIWNAVSGDESGHGAYAGSHGYDDDDDYGSGWDEEDDGGSEDPRTEVMFHVRRPGERNRLPQRDHEQYGIGWQHSRDEDEFPLRPGSPLRLAGISWKRHEPQYPNEPFEHVDFPSPMRHVSSRAPLAAVASAEEPAPEYHGEPLYHGTRSILEPGEHLTVEDAGRHPNNPDLQNDPYVHATTDPREAHRWGERANSAQAQRRMEEIGRGRRMRPGQNTDYEYRPRVYEVHPTGHVEPDLEYSDTEHDSWRSAHPMRVGREVEALPCYECHDQGAAEDEHWPGHPHYEYLRQQADEDEADREERGYYASRQPQTMEVTAMAFEPPGHFDFYHGEGSEDGKPRTSALEEHLYNHGGRVTHDYAVQDAMQRGRDEAWSGSGTNSQKRAHYHDILEGIHQHEHDRALTRAHESVQHGADPGYPAQVRQELEGAHGQQWQDEWEERGRHQEDVREHMENGQAHMHGQDVPFDEMHAHLQNEHGIPSHGLPQHQLPNSDWDDPYQRSLEEMHEQHHGDMGSYRHDEHEPVEFHGQLLGSWDAEHHLVNHHGYDINDLRRDEPDLEHEHNENHERDERFLSHPAWARMNEEGHLEEADADVPGSGDDAFEHRHVPYSAPPRSREELWRHLQEGHGVKQSADSTKEPGQSIMLKIHDAQHHGVEHYEGNANHQHDYPEGEGHDPVFGSKQARELVAHFEDPPAVRLVPVYDAAPVLDAAPSLPCPAVDAVVGSIAVLGAWEPQDATDATLGVIALKEVFEALYGRLGRVSRVIEEMPVHPDVAEGLHLMSIAARTAAEDCVRTAPGLPTEASWEEPSASPNR